jgi:hypothetical protein
MPSLVSTILAASAAFVIAVAATSREGTRSRLGHLSALIDDQSL